MASIHEGESPEVQDQKDNSHLEEWFTDIPNKTTARLYRYQFLAFCRRVHVRPWKVATMPDSDLKVVIHQWVLDMKRRADNYSGKTTKDRRGKLSVNSIPSAISPVKSFCDFYEKAIPWAKYQSRLPDRVATNLRAYRKEEVLKMMTHANIRELVCILLMVSSGIRIGGLVQLKVRNIVRISPAESGLGAELAMMVVYESSKRYRYVSFITPEALKAIDDYLLFRREHDEEITGESPLIRNRFQATRKKKEAILNGTRHVGEDAIRETIIKLMKAASVQTDLLQPDHAFRKYFNTQAKNAGIDHMYKEMFMGHSIKLDETYYDIEVPESRRKILEEYKKAINLLTMDDSHLIVQENIELKKKVKKGDEISEEVKDLKAILRQSAIERQMSDERQGELAKMIADQKAELERMQQMMKDKLRKKVSRIDRDQGRYY